MTFESNKKTNQVCNIHTLDQGKAELIDISNLETYTTVVISTALLSKEDILLFDKEVEMNDFSLVAARHTGYFVKIPHVGLNQDGESLFSDLSKQVQSVFIQAYAKGIECVEFDRDVE